MDRRQELRLALVMNGGVSLAVWMGGVTHEIDQLRRSTGAFAASDEDRTLPHWNSLLEALQIRVIVDVVAGASAGGLNGTVLATSIARGQPFPPSLRQTWIDVADISSNLVNTSVADDAPISVLDGDFFAQRIHDVFVGIATDGPPPAGAQGETLAELIAATTAALADESTPPRAVSLSVTGTSMTGNASPFVDSDGASNVEIEYRVVSRFHRTATGDVDEFAGNVATDQLSRAARASASFPLAFAPAYFYKSGGEATYEDAGPTGEGPDMGPVADVDGPRWMIDGGVLDNEPFPPLIEDIVQRPLDHDVDRVIAYVVPSSGFASAANAVYANRPGMIDVALAALSLPREVNLLNSLNRLHELDANAEVNRSQRRILLGLSMEGELDEAAASLFETYRTRRLAASAWEIRSYAVTGSGQPTAIVPPPDLAADPALEERPWVPPAREGAMFEPPNGDAPAEAGDGQAAPDPWLWGISPALRMLRAAMDFVRGAEATTPGEEAAAELSAALITLSVCVAELAALEKTVGETLADAAVGNLPDAELLNVYQALYAGGANPVPSTVAGLVEAGLGAIALVRAFLEPPFASADMSPGADAEYAARFEHAYLAVEVVERAAAPITRYTPSPRFRYLRFGLRGGGPLIGADDRDPKLTGLRLHHFGAFLKKPWRAYDWMWGRLHGANHLVAMLITGDTLAPHLSDPAQSAVLLASLEDMAGQPAVAALAEVQALTDGGAADGDVSVAIRELRRTVVGAIQREILREELPIVAEHQWGADQTNWPPELTVISGTPSDAQIASAFEVVYDQVPEPTNPIDLANTEEGKAVAGRMTTAGLRAASRDPKLPFRNRAGPALRIVASYVHRVTETGVGGWLTRIGLLAAIVVVAGTQWFIGSLHLGTFDTRLAHLGASVVLAVLLTIAALVFTGPLRVVLRWFRYLRRFIPGL